MGIAWDQVAIVGGMVLGLIAFCMATGWLAIKVGLPSALSAVLVFAALGASLWVIAEHGSRTGRERAISACQEVEIIDNTGMGWRQEFPSECSVG